VSAAQKIVNLHVVFVPIVAVVVAVPLLWKVAVGPTELILVGVLYVVTGLGIHVGFHRLFSHRCFQTYRPIRWALAVAGSMAIQGTLYAWTSDHRKHHQFSDREGDPHSPHLGGGDGPFAAIDSFFHAHFGWILTTWGVSDRDRYIPDLLAERGLRWINNLYGISILLSLAIPFWVGWLVSGGIGGALLALLWGGPVRIFLLQHVTFAVNSVGHYWGRQRFQSRDESRNVPWLACSRSATRGTTIITRFRARPFTACASVRSTWVAS
jgi:stearoyl-CoA desaturase (delta-9 desaturase)